MLLNQDGPIGKGVEPGLISDFFFFFYKSYPKIVVLVYNWGRGEAVILRTWNEALLGTLTSEEVLHAQIKHIT